MLGKFSALFKSAKEKMNNPVPVAGDEHRGSGTAPPSQYGSRRPSPWYGTASPTHPPNPLHAPLNAQHVQSPRASGSASAGEASSPVLDPYFMPNRRVSHLPPLPAIQVPPQQQQQPARPPPPPLNTNSVGVPSAPAPRGTSSPARFTVESPMSALASFKRRGNTVVTGTTAGAVSVVTPARPLPTKKRSDAASSPDPLSSDTPEKRTRHTSGDGGAAEERGARVPPPYMYTMINRVSNGAPLTMEESAGYTQPRDDDIKSAAAHTPDHDGSEMHGETLWLHPSQQGPYSVFVRPSLVDPQSPAQTPELAPVSPYFCESKSKLHEAATTTKKEGANPINDADEFFDDAMAYLAGNVDSKPAARASGGNAVHFSHLPPFSRANSLSRPAAPPPGRTERTSIPAPTRRSHDASVFGTQSLDLHTDESTAEYEYTVFNRPVRQSVVVTSTRTSLTNSTSPRQSVATPQVSDKNENSTSHENDPAKSATNGAKPSGFAARISKIVQDAKTEASAGAETWRKRAEQSIGKMTSPEEAQALRRANDLALSQWKYVALVAKKVTEKRTQVRESRVAPRRTSSMFAPLGVSALPHDRRQDSTYDRSMRKNSVFGGPFADSIVEDDEETEEVDVSVYDDNGNPLLMPNVSDLWEDIHSSDGSGNSLVFSDDDAVTVESGGRKSEKAAEGDALESSASGSRTSAGASATGSAFQATTNETAPAAPQPQPLPQQPQPQPQPQPHPTQKARYGNGAGGGYNNYAASAPGPYAGVYPQRPPPQPQPPQRPDLRMQEQLHRQQLLHQQRQQLLQQYAQQQQQQAQLQQQQQAQEQLQQQQAQQHVASPANAGVGQVYPPPPPPPSSSPQKQPRPPQPEQKPSVYTGKLPWPQPDIFHGRFVDTSHSPYVDFTAMTGVKLTDARRVDSPSWKALKVADAKREKRRSRR